MHSPKGRTLHCLIMGLNFFEMFSKVNFLYGLIMESPLPAKIYFDLSC